MSQGAKSPYLQEHRPACELPRQALTQTRLTTHSTAHILTPHRTHTQPHARTGRAWRHTQRGARDLQAEGRVRLLKHKVPDVQGPVHLGGEEDCRPHRAPGAIREISHVVPKGARSSGHALSGDRFQPCRPPRLLSAALWMWCFPQACASGSGPSPWTQGSSWRKGTSKKGHDSDMVGGGGYTSYLSWFGFSNIL